MFAFSRRFVLPALIAAFVAAPAVARAADEDDADPFYETFFDAQALALTQANLAIGVTADAIAKGVYQGETAVGVAEAYLQLNKGAHALLTAMAKDKDMDEEDAELLKQLADVANLIVQQSEATLGIAKGAEDGGAKFGKARQATTKALAEALKAIKEYFAE